MSRSWRVAVPVMAAVLVLVGAFLVVPRRLGTVGAASVEVGLGGVRRYAGPQLSLAPTAPTAPAASPDTEPDATVEEIRDRGDRLHVLGRPRLW